MSLISRPHIRFWGLKIKHLKAPNFVWQGCFLSLLSCNFDDQLSSNFNMFVISCICWDTLSEKTGLWQTPKVSRVFNASFVSVQRWERWVSAALTSQRMRERDRVRWRRGKKITWFLCWLRAVDTIGNCQRLAFTVGLSQHIHKITNLWKFELNRSSNLRDMNERKKIPLSHEVVCV